MGEKRKPTKEQLQKSLDSLLELRDKQVRLLLEQKESDPFWYFEASSGEIKGGQREFLAKWLKDEDIPQRLDGQVDVFRSNADIVGVWGGNQSGKTTVEAIDSFIQLTGEVPDSLMGVYPEDRLPKKFPVRGRVVGVDHKTFLNNLLPAYKYWVPKEFLKNGKWEDSYSSEQNSLTLWKGGKVVGTLEFMTNQQDVESFQGPPRDFIKYDEEPTLAIYKENLLRFTTADRLNVGFYMTPTHGVGSWVLDAIANKQEIGADGGSIECFRLPSVINPKANLKVLEEIVKGLSSYEEIQMRLLGSFVSLSGLVYGKLFSRKIHVIEPFDIPKDYMVIRGVDPHLVKPTFCVEMAVDPMDNCYVIGTYKGEGDVEEIKADLADRASKFRTGWTMCDKSADSTIKVLGDRNIFRELGRGKNAVPALFTSEKYAGSISAGVDEIKRRLRVNEKTGKPSLFFFNTPENKFIINAMMTLEREIRPQEEKRGIVDKIAEGKHDAHAAMRYIFQRVVRWIPPMETVPEYVPDNRTIGY